MAEARESLDGYRAAVAAYHEFYRINDSLHERYAGGTMLVSRDDHLGEAISIATDAEAKLQTAADSIK